MLGHTPPSPTPGQRPHPPLYWLLVWVALWMLIGLTGHTPWRSDESVQLALALDALQHGNWLAPELGGLPWLETPPWAVWCSAVAIGLLGGWLAPHDAARLPGLLALLACFWALLRWSLPRLQRRERWAAGLALFSAISLVIPAHGSAAELWTLAGFALLAAGLTRPDRRWTRTLVLLAGGLTLASLAGGVQLWLAGAAAVAVVSLGNPRRSQHRAHLLGVLAGSLPLLTWVLALQRQGLAGVWATTDPLLAIVVGSAHPGGGFFAELRGLLWSWPLWPLALTALWQRRANLCADPRLLGPVALLAGALLIWWLTPGGRETRTLALLAPLALLAGPGLLRLERGWAQALHAFGIVLFFALLVVIWLFWAGAHLGTPEPFATRASKLLPSYAGQWSTAQVVVSAVASVGAGLLVASLRRTPLRPLLAWCTGASVTWLLIVVLGGNWLEARLSLRPLATSLAPHWPGSGCVAAAPDLRPAVLAAVQVYAGHTPLRGSRGKTCGWVLDSLDRGRGSDEGLRGLPPQAEVVWRGRWNGDRHEVYLLYRRP
jgi:4-amino-4-deoxy-L-arabinose transferase-like glycosyltransferase